MQVKSLLCGAEYVSEEHGLAADIWEDRKSHSSADVRPGTAVGSVWLRCTPSPESSAAAAFTGAIGKEDSLLI